MQRIASMCRTASLPKHTSISPAPSRRQANSRPSFSLYRFVVSRSRGGSHSPILLEPPRLTNARPAPAVKEPLRRPLKTCRRCRDIPSSQMNSRRPGLPSDCRGSPCRSGWPTSPRHGTLGRDPTRMAKKWNHCFLELIAPPLQVGIIATVSSNTRQSRLAKNQGRRRCEPGQGAAERGGQQDGGARAAPRKTSSAPEKQRHNAPEKQRAREAARQPHSAPET